MRWRTWRVEAATSSGDEAEIDGQIFFRCRQVYEFKHGYRPMEVVCASAVDKPSGVAFRPLKECRQ